MAEFSGAVRIGDMNDFIAPSQSCVVSLNGGTLKDLDTDLNEVGAVQLQPRLKQSAPPSFNQVGAAKSSVEGPVKVSLHDCLACSGCVTSAETVLLQHQSTEELLSKLADPSITVVISLSPQSITSLAAFYGMEPADCAQRLATSLKHSGVKAVFDISWARDVALLETAYEFIDRYRSVAGHQHGMAHSASSEGEKRLPMLASACPGWICYAEKTHGTFVLPHISTAKSPQAIMGTVIKQWWCRAAGLNPENTYHCAIMPCFDKKLEAARDDFLIPGTKIPETDSVLATTEVLEWLQSQSIDLRCVQPSPLDAPFSGASSSDGRFHGIPGGSGGYLEYVFRVAAKELYNRDIPLGQLELVTGRNPDIKECRLNDNEGKPLLRFAAAYGFRNIQGLMRKLKLGRCEYDYVEVMACPSGCLNGGGQVKPTGNQSAQALIEQLEGLYHGASFVPRLPEENAAVQQFYAESQVASPCSSRALELFHTKYTKREKTVTSTLADW